MRQCIVFERARSLWNGASNGIFLGNDVKICEKIMHKNETKKLKHSFEYNTN